MTYTLDWSETDLGGSAVVSYGSGAILDFTDKPSGATSALSITSHQADGVDNIMAEFSIVTTGSSVMTFDYKVSTESGWDKFHIDVDGVSQANYSGVVAWTTHSGISIPSAGTHTIRFRYTKDSGGAVNDDRVWVALLNITNTTTVNDSSGTVDTYDMEDGAVPSFVTTSTWTNSTSEPIAGSRSLRSPASPANSGSYDLEIAKAAGSDWATVGFDFKTSTESGWDKLWLFPDATASNVPASGPPSTAGEAGWLDWSGSTSTRRIAVILPAAASSILLRYTKDGGGASGSDAVWIDNLDMPATGGGATNYNGTATRASTATVTTTGTVGKVATATRSSTATVTTGGVVGKVATAAVAATVAVAAVGVVGKSSTATVASTATTSSAGSVTSGTSATSTVASTGSIAAAGVVAGSTGSTSTSTATTTAAGVVGKVATSSLASTATVTAAGAVVSGSSASSSVAATSSIAAAGVVARTSTGSLASTAAIAATGLVEVPGSGAATISTTGTITTAGQVAATSLASIAAAATAYAQGSVGVARTSTVAATAAIVSAGVVIDPGAIAPTPPERTAVTRPENRTVTTRAESRTIATPAQPRSI